MPHVMPHVMPSKPLSVILGYRLERPQREWSSMMEPPRSLLPSHGVHTPNTTKESPTWQKTT